MSVASADISLSLPIDWENDNKHWANEAAEILKEHGVVALSRNDNYGIIDQDVCDNANRSAFTRVNEMHKRIASRGLDPKGIDQPYRFQEIICRDEGGRRFDVPIPLLGGFIDDENSSIGTPLKPTEKEAFEVLHKSIDEIVQSVVNELWESDAHSKQLNNEDKSYVAAAGFLMNKPGSQSQDWHRDGPDEGYIDCFVPLIDLNESVGPTAIHPGSHTKTSTVQETADNSEPTTPLLRKGNILLFDYRTIHRGLGNKSKATTRTLAYAVFKRKERGSAREMGDIRNFPSALTLEYD